MENKSGDDSHQLSPLPILKDHLNRLGSGSQNYLISGQVMKTFSISLMARNVLLVSVSNFVLTAIYAVWYVEVLLLVRL